MGVLQLVVLAVCTGFSERLARKENEQYLEYYRPTDCTGVNWVLLL